MTIRLLGACASALVCSALLAAPASAQSAASMAVMQNCKQDIATYCPSAQPGDGSMRDCMKKNFRSFQPTCKQALKAMMAEKQQ